MRVPPPPKGHPGGGSVCVDVIAYNFSNLLGYFPILMFDCLLSSFMDMLYLVYLPAQNSEEANKIYLMVL
jgi:hypothetical protein